MGPSDTQLSSTARIRNPSLEAGRQVWREKGADLHGSASDFSFFSFSSQLKPQSSTASPCGQSSSVLRNVVTSTGDVA